MSLPSPHQSVSQSIFLLIFFLFLFFSFLIDLTVCHKWIILMRCSQFSCCKRSRGIRANSSSPRSGSYYPESIDSQANMICWTIPYSSNLNSCASFSFFLIPLSLKPSYILVFNPATNPCDNISPLGLLSYPTPKPLSLGEDLFYIPETLSSYLRSFSKRTRNSI